MRLSLLALLLVGCRQSPPPPPPPPPAAAPSAAPVVSAASGPAAHVAAPTTAAFQLPADAPIPAGCFARSLRTGIVMCVKGIFSPPRTGSRWIVLLRNDDGPDPPFDLGSNERVPEDVRAKVNAILAADEFVALDGTPTKLPVGKQTKVGSFDASLRRVRRRNDSNQVQQDLVLSISKGAKDLFTGPLFRADCDAPRFETRPVPIGGTLFEAECTTAEGTQNVAALCDPERARCDD